MDDPVFGRSELRLPKNCDVRSLKEKKKWTRDTGIGWALNFRSFGVLNLPKVLMIFAMKSCAPFFLCPRSVILRRVATWSMGLGGVRCGNLWSLEDDFFHQWKSWHQIGDVFFWIFLFADLVYLYFSSHGRFFSGLQVDHYLTETFFRVFPSIRCAKEVQKA